MMDEADRKYHTPKMKRQRQLQQLRGIAVDILHVLKAQGHCLPGHLRNDLKTTQLRISAYIDAESLREIPNGKNDTPNPSDAPGSAQLPHIAETPPGPLHSDRPVTHGGL